MRSLVVLSFALVACLEPGAVTDEDPIPRGLSPGRYEIGSLGGSATCLDVHANGSGDGTRIQSWQCNGSAAQVFRLESLPGGLARLVHVASGKCADVAGAGTTDGTALHLWTCNGTVAQELVAEEAGGGLVQLRNPHSNRCVDVNAGSPANGAKVQIWQCNGTLAQRWRPRLLDGPPPPPPPAGGLPAKVVAGYYPNWTPSPIRLRDVPAAYNVIYLFSAQPVGGPPGTTGEVTWSPPGNGRGAATHLVADIAYARQVQGRKILLSVGGAGYGMSFPDRGKSQRFVDSIASLHAQLGGFDGLDWNTFEADQAPDTAEMIWISHELKKRFPGFIVTCPPAPWNQRDKNFVAAMVAAGALDAAAPQYYDGPGLDQQEYMVKNVAEWVALVGASRVVVGFGIWDQPNYMSIGEAVPTWLALEAAHPSLRGAFDWNIHLDESQGWPFASQLGPLVP